MSKKKKRGVRRLDTPALSKTDSTLYILLMILIGFVLPYGMLFGIDAASKHLASSNPHMTAWTATGATLQIIPIILLPIASVCFFMSLLAAGQPLFGRTDVTYGYPKDAAVYPLFRKSRHKRPPTAAALRAHRKLRKASVLLFCLYLLVGAIGAAGICPRCELQDDETLVCYNVINKPVRRYAAGSLTDVSIGTKPTRYGWNTYVRLTVSDGRRIEFSTPRMCAKLTDLIRILPPETVTVSGADDLPRVFEYYALTESEEDALRELFGVS